MSTDLRKDFRTGALYAVVTAFVAAILFGAAAGPELLKDFLLADDGYWVAMPLNGARQAPERYELFHAILYAWAQTGSIGLIRAYLLTSHALSTGLLAFILLRCGVPKILAAAGSLACMTLPIFPMQYFYISASHAIAALPLVMFALVLLTAMRPARGFALNATFALTALGLTLASSYISPLFTLMPVLVPAALWFFSTSRDPRIRYGSAILGTTVVVAFLVWSLVLRPHVYLSTTGWVDGSPGGAIANFEHAIRIIIGAYWPSQFWRLGLVLLGAVAFAAAAGIGLTRRSPTFRLVGSASWATPALLLIASALSFAPAAALTFMSDRYVLMPAVFGVASAICLFGVSTYSRLSVSGMVIGSALLAAGNLVVLSSAQARGVAGLSDSHRWLELIASHSSEWKPDAQVVVFLPDRLRSPTSGYPHFSSAYLRWLAKRNDIIGLIGHESQATGWPFVPKQNLFGMGKGYWVVQNGKTGRTGMAGLRMDGPIYVYTADAQGEPNLEQKVTFINPDLIVRSSAGTAARAVQASACRSDGWTESFVWPYSASLTKSPSLEATEFLDTSVTKSRKKVALQFPSGAKVEMALGLAKAVDSTPSTPYGQSIPPMPAINPGFGVYQSGKSFSISDPITKRTASVSSGAGPVLLTLSGIEGCGYHLFAGGKRILSLGRASLSGDWTWGAGFLDRFWQGKIFLAVQINGQTVPLD